jgi:predicted secreted protein
MIVSEAVTMTVMMTVTDVSMMTVNEDWMVTGNDDCEWRLWMVSGRRWALWMMNTNRNDCDWWLRTTLWIMIVNDDCDDDSDWQLIVPLNDGHRSQSSLTAITPHAAVIDCDNELLRLMALSLGDDLWRLRMATAKTVVNDDCELWLQRMAAKDGCDLWSMLTVMNVKWRTTTGNGCCKWWQNRDNDSKWRMWAIA